MPADGVKHQVKVDAGGFSIQSIAIGEWRSGHKDKDGVGGDLSSVVCISRSSTQQIQLFVIELFLRNYVFLP